MEFLELSKITPYMFDAKCEGFTKLKDLEETNFQRLAYTIYKIEFGKDGKLAMEDVWRLRSDKSKVIAKSGMVKDLAQATIEAFSKMSIKPVE